MVPRPPGSPRPLGLARSGVASLRRAWSSRIRLERRVFHRPDTDRRSTVLESLRRIVTMSRYGQALTSHGEAVRRPIGRGREQPARHMDDARVREVVECAARALLM